MLRRFQFSIGDAELSGASPGGTYTFSFNSLLEMLQSRTSAGRLHARCQFQFSIGDATLATSPQPRHAPRRFQFSIGDANSLAMSSRASSACLFQFSIGDARRAYSSNARTRSLFQFSIGDAVAASPWLGRGSTYVSILYWRCITLLLHPQLIPPGRFNSLLEMHTPYTTAASWPNYMPRFQFSIGDAVCLRRLRPLSYRFRVSILYWRCPSST